MDQVTGIALILALVALTLGRKRRRRPTRRSGRRTTQSRPRNTAPPGARRPYPGDFTGTVQTVYSARLDGKADPGEIVWTWVPFEDDHTQGKDRPVIVIGRDGQWLLALMLSSKDHDREGADAARWGRRWLDIGAGPWDRQRRPSEVRLDRVVRVHPDDVRREGALMDRQLFDTIARSL